MEYPETLFLAGNSKEIIVQGIKTDDLVKFQKELDTLLALKTVTELVETTYDEYGNNLWTMAAENGTEEIMNFLLDMISSWPNKDLDHVLHFWTCHREHSCMAILETFKTTILDCNYEDFKFKNLKKHLNINSSKPSELRDYLKTTKKHLDTTIASLGNTMRKMKRWDSERKTPNQLRRTLEDLRTGLLLNDLEWHHSSLTGIVSQSYPPDSITAKRIFKLEIECHNQSQPKATLNETHIEKGGKEGSELKGVSSEENEPDPSIGTFLSCIYQRVGKSPCTLEALKMATSQTSTSVSKWNLMSSFYSLMMKRYPFLICLSLFFFSFGLLVLDISTDVKLVWGLYHTEIEKMEAKDYIFGNNHVIRDLLHFKNVLLGLTLFAIIIPIAGYFVSWLISNKMGFATLKNKVILFSLLLGILVLIKK